MKLFLNDKPVWIVQLGEQLDGSNYDAVLDGKNEIISKNLVGNVIIMGASPSHIDRLLKLLEVKKLKKLKEITFAVPDKKFAVEFVKDQFKIVKAAGGIVVKEDKILMIFRLKKWDLPKGKLRKKEDSEKGAKREVEEECNIKVEVKEKICKTWHTYVRKGRRILKKTTWYLMENVNDSMMRPQIEEYIEDVRWMDKRDVKKASKNSYRSIEEVLDNFYKEKTIL